MATVVTEEHHEAEETKEGERELERDLGHAESEIEHHSETLEEHEQHLGSLKADREWLQSEILRIEEMVSSLPQVPRELLEDLTARVTHLEEQITHQVQQATELPGEIVQEAPKESRSLLDRIL